MESSLLDSFICDIVPNENFATPMVLKCPMPIEVSHFQKGLVMLENMYETYVDHANIEFRKIVKRFNDNLVIHLRCKKIQKFLIDNPDSKDKLRTLTILTSDW